MEAEEAEPTSAQLYARACVVVLPVTGNSITRAIEVLRSGGVIAHSTETCYGLACDLTNVDALDRLYALKRRPKNEAVSALFANIEQVRAYVEWNECAEELAQQHLPGPLTLVLPLREFPLGDRSPLVCVPGQRTLGIRISSHPVAQALVEKVGVPLSTTSANIHGQPESYSVQEIQGQFVGAPLQPDVVLDGGVLQEAPPSTVVAVREGRVVVLRQGSIRLTIS